MLESLRSIVQQVSDATDLGLALDIIVRRVRQVMGVNVCSVYLRDGESGRFVLMATQGLKRRAVRKVSLGADEGLVGLVATREEPINLESADQHPRFQYIPETGEEKYSSFLGVPVIHHRRVLGVLVVQQKARRRFDESEEAFLTTLSAQLAGVIAHAESTGDLAQLTKRGGDTKREIEFHGIPGAPGISIGQVVVISPIADLYAVSAVKSKGKNAELEEYRLAIEKTRKDIRELEHGLKAHISEQERLLFTAYVQMLDDQSLGKEVIARIADGQSAQASWSEVILAHCRRFEEMGDSYLRERASDLRDIGRRVLGHMQERDVEEIDFPENTILVGEDLTASNLGMVPPEKLAGLVSVKGSTNSHLAILARAMGIPTVVGVGGLRIGRLRGEELIIDGYNGHIYLNATAAHRSHFEEILREDRQLLAELEVLRDEPAVTLDGSSVSLLVNTGLMADVKVSLERGAEGVGLFRSEVPFLTRDRFPIEEEQRKFYRDLLEPFAPRTVVMRTLDIGGDKALPYFPIREENPFLGWRGIRVTLDHPELFLAQTRAMMKASEGLDNLSMLLPMISGISELEESLVLIRRAYQELTDEEGLEIKMPRIGVMIEVPSAVFLARDLASRVDFLSVGSNDLTQYILAVDRNNSRVADLYQSMHPAVLAALNHVVKAAHAEGKQAGVCGELAGDPLGAILLLAMGYDTLSMNASNLLRVKAFIRQTRAEHIRPLLRSVLRSSTSSEVQEHLLEFVSDPQLRRLTALAPGLGQS